MQRICLLLLTATALAACTSTNGPDGTTPPTPNTVAMTQLTDLPMAGGDVTGIAITPGNTMVAIIDGKLYSTDAAGGSMQLINGDATHMAMGLAPSGELYALTDKEIRTYDRSSGTFKTVPIDPAGPLAINRRVEQAEFVFSPSGEPYVRMINNTPQTYIYHTTDKGTTWTAVKLAPGFVYAGGFTFAPNGDMLMANAFAFYRSTDAGATWTSQAPPLANYGGELLVTTGGDIFYYVRGGGGLKVSHDGGASFTDLATFNRPPYFAVVRQGPDGALYALAARSAATYDLIARPTSLLRSADGGKTWTHVMFAQGHDFAMRGSMMAIGLGTTGSGNNGGGIMISQNNGSTWMTAGNRPVNQVMDVGFDKDGTLMILADNGLFRKTAGGWQTFGIQPGLFSRFASTPQGALLLANTGAVFNSSDNGATWTESPVTNYVPGIDPAAITVLIGRRSGGFIMSITSYSDSRGYSNGQLYRIGADGVPVKVTTATQTLSSMIEDANGILYGGTQVLDPFSNTFRGSGYKSVDGGTTWTEQTTGPGSWAFNSANRYFAITGQTTFALKTLGSDAVTDLKLDGFTSQGNSVTRVKFGPDDKLYIVTMDKGLFVSGGAVR